MTPEPIDIIVTVSRLASVGFAAAYLLIGLKSFGRVMDSPLERRSHYLGTYLIVLAVFIGVIVAMLRGAPGSFATPVTFGGTGMLLFSVILRCRGRSRTIRQIRSMRQHPANAASSQAGAPDRRRDAGPR